MPIRIIGAPLLREADGLAMSSRNVRLDPAARAAALSISAALRSAAAAAEAGERSGDVLAGGVRASIEAAGGSCDYVQAVSQATLQPLPLLGTEPCVLVVAARFGGVRLLDNWEL